MKNRKTKTHSNTIANRKILFIDAIVCYQAPLFYLLTLLFVIEVPLFCF